MATKAKANGLHTEDTPAFEGRVIFHCRHYSLGMIQRHNRLLELASERHAQLNEQYPGVLDGLITALILTPAITFDFQGDETLLLQEFRDFWTAYLKADEASQIDLAVEWRLSTNIKIMDGWSTAYSNASQPYRDPVTAPEDALTSLEKEALEDLESPLEENA